MQFTPHFLDEIRNRIPLVQLVGKRVNLSKRGSEFIGLCPFHNEKTPSFTINEDKGFFHCFGCGAHGDIIAFLMLDEGLTFPEAVERLSSEAGLEMPKETPEERNRQKEASSLFQINAFAQEWFTKQLMSPPAQSARSYLEQRGLNFEAIKTFGLGYSPNDRNSLSKELNTKGINDKILTNTGLLINTESDNKPYDRFRGRIIFPIKDIRGRVVGFGGRSLGKGMPKYLNSPETPIFQKGSLLYGLDLARKIARDLGQLVVVEGYMDVIALYQSGIKEVVAPLGTAITDNQLAQLWKIVDDPILCFDGDEAGHRAANRVVERALGQIQPGKSLRFIRLAQGEDPDSIVRLNGPDSFRSMMADAEPLSALIWRIVGGEQKLDTPEKLAAVSKKLDDMMKYLKDSDMRKIFRKYYRDRIFSLRSENTKIEASTTKNMITDTHAHNEKKTDSTSVPPRALALSAEAALARQRSLLQILLNYPVLAEEFHEELEKFPFSAPRFASLGDALLRSCQLSEIDTNEKKILDLNSIAGERLKEELIKSGLQELAVEVIKIGSIHFDGAAKEDTLEDANAIQKARIQIRHLLDLHYKLVNMEDFKREATEVLAADMTEENWEKLKATIDSMDEAPGTEDYIPKGPITNDGIKQ